MTEPASQPPGKLTIYLGYAAGVGKTYQMLDRGQELRGQGVDVVVGYFELHGRQDTISKAQGLEVVPRRTISYRGTSFEEMDTEAILRRNPRVCLVDELAHTNVPGSERLKRWQDVRALLEAGIEVLTTLNVQHLESLNDEVWQLTGVRVRETLPDWVVDEAGEIILVDVTPRALRHRLERGVVYAPDKARQALERFFTEPNLNALRELAMRHTAHEIEDRLAEEPRQEAPAPSGRILICLTASPSAATLIRRGRRLADYLRTDCLAAYVTADRGLQGLSSPDREALEKHLNFARNLRIETHILEGGDPAETLVNFARSRKVSQILMGQGGKILHRVVRLARDMEITIVADRRRK